MNKPFSVEEVQALLPEFTVEEAADVPGVVAYLTKSLTYYDTNALNPMSQIIRAALTLKLHPDQIEDDSEYTDRTEMGSSWTGEYGSRDIDYYVTFLYEPPKG